MTFDYCMNKTNEYEKKKSALLYKNDSKVKQHYFEKNNQNMQILATPSLRRIETTECVRFQCV